jgi:predicted heme/steroid binding protein
LAACGQGTTATTNAAGPAATTASGGTAGTDTTAAAQSKTFTVAELARFNGQNGTPAYVAVDGVVYDVSNSAYWKSGQHSSCNLGAMAGQDLSELIKQAPPRMRSDLQRMPVVGSLAK